MKSKLGYNNNIVHVREHLYTIRTVIYIYEFLVNGKLIRQNIYAHLSENILFYFI